jgi:PilZ domain
MLPRSLDKRKTLRLGTRRFAEVQFGTSESSVRCVVWDISDGGARLAIARPLMNLPPRFRLSLGRDGRDQRNCEVVWTDTRFVGVRFL